MNDYTEWNGNELIVLYNQQSKNNTTCEHDDYYSDSPEHDDWQGTYNDFC